jgi:3-mercaptopyruvate sulfurtransferase SseA
VLSLCRPLATPQLQQHRTLPQQQQQQRHRQQRLTCNASSSIGAEEAKRLIEREGYKILDVRSARDYDDKHITKPARCSISAPVVMNDNVTPNARFLAEVGSDKGRAYKRGSSGS